MDSSSPHTPDAELSAPPTPASPDAETPDLARTGEAIDGNRGRSVEITVLTVLALLYTMYFARTFLVPVVFALLLNFLLSPVIRILGRIRLKPPIAALVVIVVLVAGAVGTAYQLAGRRSSGRRVRRRASLRRSFCDHIASLAAIGEFRWPARRWRAPDDGAVSRRGSHSERSRGIQAR